jgi:hypothetical protein
MGHSIKTLNHSYSLMEMVKLSGPHHEGQLCVHCTSFIHSSTLMHLCVAPRTIGHYLKTLNHSYSLMKMVKLSVVHIMRGSSVFSVAHSFIPALNCTSVRLPER